MQDKPEYNIDNAFTSVFIEFFCTIQKCSENSQQRNDEGTTAEFFTIKAFCF